VLHLLLLRHGPSHPKDQVLETPPPLKNSWIRLMLFTHYEQNANRQMPCAVTFAHGIPLFAMKRIKYARLFTLVLYRNRCTRALVELTLYSSKIPSIRVSNPCNKPINSMIASIRWPSRNSS
jgi:hypothetical protein